MKLVSVSEMQAVEREADTRGLTYAQMMENAGHGLAEAVIRQYGQSGEPGARFTAGGLVGSGNNGGDALVALAELAKLGWKTSACLVRPRPKSDPLIARLLNAGGEIVTTEALDPWIRGFDRNAVLFDGVLGTGARLPLKPELAAALETVRQLVLERSNPPHIVAVDCPSGVDCDTGEAAPECIPAELTVTMAAIKQGLLKFPAFKLIGELRLVGIGSIDHLAAWKKLHRQVAEAEMVRSILPPRPLDAHKGTFGAAMVVGGSVNYTGAVCLAGEAAYRVGAGWVMLAVPEPLHTALAGSFIEATWVLLPHNVGVIAAPAAEVVKKNLERVTAMLVGPGLGLEDTTREFLARFLVASTSKYQSSIGFVGAAKVPPTHALILPALVIDADGLKLLAKLPGWPSLLPAPAVLTPHPGEFAVLTGLGRDEIQADRIGLAEKYAQEWGHVVVLKGAFTIIAAPDGQTTIIPVATPALARAGTGDVLAGLIVGLRAQGVAAYEAAVAGAWIHAQAGLVAARQLGSTASVLAGDVGKAVPSVMSGFISH